MKKIKFVRKFYAYDDFWFDVCYETGRVSGTKRYEDLPKTVREYMAGADIKVSFDPVLRRTEIYYI